MDMLTLSRVSKAFGKNKVLEDISFTVPEHTIYGFIGQNGAGKTTVMKLILGLLKSDSGEILVNGERVVYGQNRTNKYIGYLPDVPEFYGFMTPMEYLTLCGRITGMPENQLHLRAGELLELVGLEPANRRIQGFSRGMKQRLGIAQSLLHNPQLLICDEPTSALDPSGRKEILDILSSVKEFVTVIFSTHILSDVERICDEIAFLHNGSIACCGTLEEIKGIRKGSGLEIEFYSWEDAGLLASKCSGSRRVGRMKLQYAQRTERDMLDIMKVLVKNNIPVQRIEMLEPTLEDLFMEVVRE